MSIAWQAPAREDPYPERAPVGTQVAVITLRASLQREAFGIGPKGKPSFRRGARLLGFAEAMLAVGQSQRRNGRHRCRRTRRLGRTRRRRRLRRYRTRRPRSGSAGAVTLPARARRKASGLVVIVLSASPARRSAPSLRGWRAIWNARAGLRGSRPSPLSMATRLADHGVAWLPYPLIGRSAATPRRTEGCDLTRSGACSRAKAPFAVRAVTG